MKVLYYYITRLGCWEVTQVKETWPGNARFNFFSATCADVSEGNCDSEFNLAKGEGEVGVNAGRGFRRLPAGWLLRQHHGPEVHSALSRDQ